ncbi:hypothetical protein Agub_g3068 [Astrephomene gubernaculifera]|uniref:C2 NT-type domain-containing protein n=1 Tax=Astrephomene gubernaculifera TaxID=47775 RepID=A0AAD3HIS0_9CHLO|nr:hypothetical protein Agub_g3068 [Astrephomene gubernaculifera]
MGKTIGRRMVDIGQKARGRMALRYELEVIPYLCGDLPDGVTHCSFAWERGSKLFVTEAEPVNPNTHAVFWKQYLRQTATMYKDHQELLPKDYTFKVQSVKLGSKPGDEKRKTVGKVHVNMAQFCSEALDAQPQEILLHLKPSGKLKVSIKATWLSHATLDADAMTEVTAPSMYADSHYEEEEDEEEGGARKREEQDLSGFDPETGEPLPAHSRHVAGASCSGAGEEYDEEGNPLPGRRNRKQRRRSRRARSQGESGIPEDAESAYGGENGEEGTRDYGDPGGEEGGGGREAGDDHHGGEGRGRRGRAGSRAGKGEGRSRLQVYGATDRTAPMEGGGTSGGVLRLEVGRQVFRPGWRDYLCCCLPRHGPPEDPLEADSLLAAQQQQQQGKAPSSNGDGRAPPARRR